MITCLSHPGLCQWFLVILIQLTACTVHVGADFVWKGSITNESQFQNSVNTLEIFTWCCTNFSWRQIRKRKHLLMTMMMKIMIIMRWKLRNRKINMSKPMPQCSFGRAILLLLKLRMIINIICPTLPLPHMNYRHKPQYKHTFPLLPCVLEGNYLKQHKETAGLISAFFVIGNHLTLPTITEKSEVKRWKCFLEIMIWTKVFVN